MGPPLRHDRCQRLVQLCEKLLPAGMRAAIGLLLAGPEARLLDAQMRACVRRRQREGHHALEVVGRILMREIPGVGERSLRLDGEDLAVQHAAPFAAKIEAVTDDGLEVVLHQPFLDQMRLRQRAPEPLRRKSKFALDDYGTGFSRGFGHWSILFRRSLRASSRFCQKPAIWLVQSTSGSSAPGCAL